MPNVTVKLHDVTLRDGNHALRHGLTPALVASYCQIAETSGSHSLEVGHGNGLGASSYLVGKSAHIDFELLSVAREHLSSVLLGVHTIPGFATRDRDLNPALDLGVDLFRVATHASEADVSEKHIEYLSSRNAIVHGVLMMTHMLSPKELAAQAKLMADYGATAVVIMDSAGHYQPVHVAERVSAVLESTGIEVGFHAHNNLGVAVSNALSAIEMGATIIDGSTMGLGAGAGNAQLENIAANLLRDRSNLASLEKYFELSKLIEERCRDFLPRTTSSSIESALAGVFSGYAPQVRALSEELGVNPSALWAAIGERKLVAGQESMIREIAQDLMNI